MSEIKSKFIVSSDQYTGNIEALASRAICFGKITEKGEVIIEDKSLTKDDMIKLSLVIRFIAHSFDETIPSIVRPVDLTGVTNQRVEAVGSKLSELATKTGFAKKVGHGQYIVHSYKIDAFLSSLENKGGAFLERGPRSNRKKRKKGESTKTLTGVGQDIQSLVDSGFFDVPKQISEVLKELKRKGYTHDSRVVDRTITATFLKNRNVLDREENRDGGKSKWKYFVKR